MTTTRSTATTVPYQPVHTGRASRPGRQRLGTAAEARRRCAGDDAEFLARLGQFELLMSSSNAHPATRCGRDA